MGGWIVAALLLLGYNGFALVSMFNPPLVRISDEVKLAREKWRQLQDRNLLALKKNKKDLERIFPKSVPSDQKQEKQAVISPLPVLTGIMRFSDVQGNKRWVAVIEGKTYTEKTQVQGYTIQQITEKGVVLTKAGISRFVPTPEVYFSVDRSGLVAKDTSGTPEEEESSKVSER